MNQSLHVMFRHISLFLSVVFLCGPSVGAERPVRSLLEMRQENLIMQQWDISCGAAALATILTYHHGFPVTEKQVVQGMLRQTDAVRVKHRGGFSLLDMQRYLALLGFQGDGFANMTLQDLAPQLPMIIPIRARGYDHFVIVRRLSGNRVEIGDPGFGNYHMREADFLRIWSGVGFHVQRLAGEQ